MCLNNYDYAMMAALVIGDVALVSLLIVSFYEYRKSKKPLK
jgi:hypothetical protein